MSQDVLAALVAVAIMLLVGFPVHEFSHALAAFRLGDSTARYQGRLTLDPRVHFDPMGGALLAISALLPGGIFFGWAKPTPVNPLNLDGGRRGEALVALAGPLSNLVMAAVVAVPIRVLTMGDSPLIGDVVADPIGSFVFEVAVTFVVINAFLCIFNLLPIAPLDGWRVAMGLLPARTAYQLRQYEQYGFIALLLLVLLESQTPGGFIIGRLGRALIGFLLGV